MTEKIARRGYHIYREYGVDPLERHYVDEVMTRTVESIDADVTVAMRSRRSLAKRRRVAPIRSCARAR